MCTFWLQGELLKSVEIVNLVTGDVATSRQIPSSGGGISGCAVVYEGYLYWVKANQTPDFFRAQRKLKTYLDALCEVLGLTAQ